MSVSVVRDPPHGRTASLRLHFDGSVSSHQQQFGCAAVVDIRFDDDTSQSFKISRPLGNCTSNEAEYLGLIYGLYGAFSYLGTHRVRHSFCSLVMIGDSELVLNQLKGTYRVTAPNLQPLHALARSLASRFSKSAVAHVPRKRNECANQLANKARISTAAPESRATYRPNLAFLLPVRVQGKRTVASNDVLTYGHDPNNYIDVSFLRSLPNGEALFLNMCTASPLSLLIARTDMTVLGCVMLQLEILWRVAGVQSACVEFFVVLRLPVPVHISMRNARMPKMPEEEPGPNELRQFDVDELPAEYARHEYWRGDSTSLGEVFDIPFFTCL